MIALLLSVAFAQPCTVVQTKRHASDASGGSQFGYAVAMDGPEGTLGPLAVVGAWTSGNGKAYVFRRYVFGTPGSPPGWNQEALLVASDGAPADAFGGAVAVSVTAAGDRVVIGAQDADVPAANAGAAYVFRKVGASWVQEAKLTAGDGAFGDRFGYSVAIDGLTIVVGANQDDGPFGNQGSAWVFTYDGSAWQRAQKLLASNGAAFDYFGDSVTISGGGTTIAIGCPTCGATDKGAVYIFTKPASMWTQQTIITPADAADYDMFGGALNMDGTALMIGAPGDDGPQIDRGSAYRFDYGATWAQTSKLTATDGAAGDNLGLAVGISIGAGGTDIVAGAFSNGVAGAAYWWRGSDPHIKLTAADQGFNDYFGWGVATSGGHVLAGAHQDDDNGLSSGSAYFFRCGAEQPQTGCTTGADCNDANACTIDSCVSSTCVYTPVNCDDGLACTLDACVNGACVHTCP